MYTRTGIITEDTWFALNLRKNGKNGFENWGAPSCLTTVSFYMLIVSDSLYCFFWTSVITLYIQTSWYPHCELWSNLWVVEPLVKKPSDKVRWSAVMVKGLACLDGITINLDNVSKSHKTNWAILSVQESISSLLLLGL